MARFETIPDLLELDHLTVSGDVTFGKGVSLKVSSFLVLVEHNLVPRVLSYPPYGENPGNEVG